MRITFIQRLIAATGVAIVMSAGANAQQPTGQQGQPPAQQQTQQQAQPQAQQQAQVEIDDQTLEQFADALGTITEIQTEYSASIGATQDPQEAQSLQQEAQTKMVEAVQEAGLDVETYNVIAQQLAADPELQQRVQDLL